MLDRSKLHLAVIVESIDSIRDYIAGVTRDAFVADQMRRDAVALRFQVMGEAARLLTPDQRAEAPEIPRNHIVGLRHRISHDYRTVNFELVWEIIHTEFDALRAAAVRMLTARGETI